MSSSDTDRPLDAAIHRLRLTAGGYLRNPIRGSDLTCGVCTGPVSGFDSCFRCNSDRRKHGRQLADQVVPIAYGIAGQQSGQILRGYKNEYYPVRQHQEVLSLLLAVTFALHERCLQRHAKSGFDHWTTVPSTRDRQGDHPLRSLVGRLRRPEQEFRLTTDVRREPDDRESDSRRFRPARPEPIGGSNVLIIDDTWTSGGRAQSAALMLRSLGAESVSVLVLGRWVNPDDAASKRLLSGLDRDFDPHLCPVTGSECPQW